MRMRTKVEITYRAVLKVTFPDVDITFIHIYRDTAIVEVAAAEGVVIVVPGDLTRSDCHNIQMLSSDECGLFLHWFR